jgi:putative acetyltransferase
VDNPDASAMIIREEIPSDWLEVDSLLKAAFGGRYEADLVSRLRSDGLAAIILVAEAKNQAIGHIVLSWLPTRVESRSIRALALAPLAVRPDQQRRGVGSQLVKAAIEAAKVAGAEAVIVLGHPSYYPRFGFSADLAARLARLPGRPSWPWSWCLARWPERRARSPTRQHSTSDQTSVAHHKVAIGILYSFGTAVAMSSSSE